MKKLLLFIVLVLLSVQIASLQGELAATLEVLDPGVEVLRVNTINWVPVNVEAIVGVGDTIRTGDTGRARVTYFADGVDTEILPGTEYVINQFEGDADSYQIEASVLIGQTTQRLNRLLDANSSYNILTPSMELVARGTQFDIRVESNGRAAMLVDEGAVNAEAESDSAEVPPGFGIRAQDSLSDVVAATSFDELDAALDGCTASVEWQDDISINVRIAPNVDAERIGTVAPQDINLFIGRTETTGWYRIDFRGGFGWILSSSAAIGDGCAGLRVFPDNHGPEDVTLYTSLGDSVDVESLPQPDDEVEATPEATESP